TRGTRGRSGRGWLGGSEGGYRGLSRSAGGPGKGRETATVVSLRAVSKELRRASSEESVASTPSSILRRIARASAKTRAIRRRIVRAVRSSPFRRSATPPRYAPSERDSTWGVSLSTRSTWPSPWARVLAVSADEHQLRLERWEVALASAALEDPGRLPREREAALRWALGLARIRRFGGIDLEPLLARFRDE